MKPNIRSSIEALQISQLERRLKPILPPSPTQHVDVTLLVMMLLAGVAYIGIVAVLAWQFSR